MSNVRDKPTSHVKDLSNVEDITPPRQTGHAPHVKVDPAPVPVPEPEPEPGSAPAGEP